MNSIFNIKRFGRYLAYDMNNARARFGASALVIGLLPFMALLIELIYHLVFPRGIEGAALTVPSELCALAALVVVIFSAPIKLYGHLTDKKSGSEWILIPATLFEKFLSMLIVTLLIIPLVVFGLSWLSDGIISIFINGEDYFSDFFRSFHEEMFSAETVTSGFGMVVLPLLMLWTSILPFLLGALVFKKQKGGYTMLCLMGLNCVLVLLGVLILQHIDWDHFSTYFDDSETSAQRVQFIVNFLLNAFFLIVDGSFITAIYFRLKTLKH